MGSNYSSRRSKLIRQLKNLGVDGLLISGLSNVRYLTGFTGDSTWLFVTASDTLMLSDTRYETQLEDECPGVGVRIRDARRSMNDVVSDVVRESGIERLGIESDHLTLSQFHALQSKTEAIEFIFTASAVEQLRQIKDKWELEQIRDAIRFAEKGIAVVRSMLRPDLSERQIRFILEEAMRSFGAGGTAFEPIVGVGPTGALPHAHAGLRLVSDSPALLIDWGAQTFSGYRSDLTRVFFTARPTRQMQQVYEVVLKAQQAAIQAIRPGVRCCEVDAVARNLIAEAGFGRYFGHGLGHGIGLDIHESARMSPSSEQVFEAGMVTTVEPGIYLPGKFGVRIEDDVLVTAGGYEVLTSVPREFADAVV